VCRERATQPASVAAAGPEGRLSEGLNGLQCEPRLHRAALECRQRPDAFLHLLAREIARCRAADAAHAARRAAAASDHTSACPCRRTNCSRREERRRRVIGEHGVIQRGLLGVSEFDAACVRGPADPAAPERRCVRLRPEPPMGRVAGKREGAAVQDRIPAQPIAGAPAVGPRKGALVLAPEFGRLCMVQ